MPCLPQTDCMTGCRDCKPHMSWAALKLNHERNNLNFSQGSCANRLRCKDKITANEERGGGGVGVVGGCGGGQSGGGGGGGYV